MITKSTFSFLTELKENNNREWFNQNKQRYESAREEFLDFISLLIAGLSSVESGLSVLRAKDAAFRIYRDVRFSADKSPYKTQMGAQMVGGGKKSGRAGYYFHLEPGGCFAGGGIWHPDPERLRVLRMEIFENTDEFRSILGNREFSETFGGIRGEQLSRAPKGFPADHPDIDLLKFKSYTVFRGFPDSVILSPGAQDDLLEAFRIMKPFNDFINHAFEG